MLPTELNIALMTTGYLLVMGYLALGLALSRRGPGRERKRERRGWPGLARRVAGTAVGGYLLLTAVVVGYYEGVARLGGDFLASAATENALLAGLTMTGFLALSWVVVRLRRR